jgi:hypothetical protein
MRKVGHSVTKPPASVAQHRLSGSVLARCYDAGCEGSVAARRDAIGARDFERAWAEGTGLFTEEGIAYA